MSRRDGPHRDPDPRAGEPGLSEVWVTSPQGLVRVRLGDIEAIEAAGDYVLLHTPDRSHLHRARLRDLLSALPAADWVRVHRSALVRIERVAELQGPARRTRLALNSGRLLAVSRPHVAEVKSRLGLGDRR